MTHDVTRREFVGAATALAGAVLWPAPAMTDQAPAPTDGTVILFQGDSITDAGRDRGLADPNAARALGSGHPLLAPSAALPAHPEPAPRFYNRGVLGNKRPAPAPRGAAATGRLRPALLS